jgi:hypothetical protein
VFDTVLVVKMIGMEKRQLASQSGVENHDPSPLLGQQNQRRGMAGGAAASKKAEHELTALTP